jgi:hypothetical protein
LRIGHLEGEALWDTRSSSNVCGNNSMFTDVKSLSRPRKFSIGDKLYTSFKQGPVILATIEETDIVIDDVYHLSCYDYLILSPMKLTRQFWMLGDPTPDKEGIRKIYVMHLESKTCFPARIKDNTLWVNFRLH